MDIEECLKEAKAGDAATLGQLLEAYRNYLRLLARVEIGRRLQGKVDASDVVQATLMDAVRYFPNFRGQAEGQFVCWLREILAGTIANQVRRYFGTQARDVRLETALVASVDQSAGALSQLLVDPQSSPSNLAAKAEQVGLVAEALSKLPEDYQTVLILRHLEGLTFPQVADRMGRSVDSVEKLWIRGLTKLRRECAGEA